MAITPFTKELTQFEQMLREAYERGRAAGYEAGATEMRESILKAANAVPGGKVVEQANLDRLLSPPPTDKMPRGRTRQLIDVILDGAPGLRATEIQQRVLEMDRNASIKTVYNELIRQKDKRYRRDGDKWFLIVDLLDGPDKRTARAGTLADMLGRQ